MFFRASTLAYALDEARSPVLAVGRDSEHAQNMMADPRVSFSTVYANTEDAHNDITPKLTLMAEAKPLAPNAALHERYLRYLPKSEHMLGRNCALFRLRPRRIHHNGGLGRRAWIEEADWNALPALPAHVEARFLEETSTQSPNRVKLLGADCFGINCEVKGERHRQRFPNAPLSAEDSIIAAPRFAAELC